MSITHVFGGLPTSDFGLALRWYERLFGRPPDRLSHDREAVWLTETGLVYVLDDPVRAGQGLLTLIVDDLDAHVTELEHRGIAPGPTDTIPGAARTVNVSDPDGNSIQIGQVG